MGLIFLFTKVFIFFKHQYYPLQNSSLGQLHTDGDIVATFGSSTGSLQHVHYTLLDVFLSPEMTFFEYIFKFSKKEKVTESEVR